MKIARKHLLGVLEAVSPGLAQKEIIEQSTSFVFKRGVVFTFNDEISVSHPLDVDFEGAVQAKELHAFLSKSNEDEITLKMAATELRITSGRSRAGIRLDDEITLPVDEVDPPGEWLPLPESFIEGLKFCIPAAGSDMTTPVLTCVSLTPEELTAADDTKISIWEFQEPAEGLEGLIPALTASKLLKYSPTHFSVTDSWVHFKLDNGAEFSCRLFEGKYPDISKIIDFEGTPIRFPPNTREILDRAGIFASGQFDHDNTVSISLADNKMKIRAESSHGWIQETTRARYKSEGVTFFVHPGVLDSILSHSHAVIISDSLMKFEGERFCHMIALKLFEDN